MFAEQDIKKRQNSPDNILNKLASWLFPTSANIHLSKILILQKDYSNTHEHPKSYLWGKELQLLYYFTHKQYKQFSSNKYLKICDIFPRTFPKRWLWNGLHWMVGKIPFGSLFILFFSCGQQKKLWQTECQIILLC